MKNIYCRKGDMTFMLLDDNGHASILRDLLKIGHTFRFRRYRVDLLGFLLAWILVLVFITFYWWMSVWK